MSISSPYLNQPNSDFSGCNPTIKKIGKIFLVAALVVGAVLAIHYGVPHLANLNLNTLEWCGVGAGIGLLAIGTGALAKKILQPTVENKDDDNRSEHSVDRESLYADPKLYPINPYLVDRLPEVLRSQKPKDVRRRIAATLDESGQVPVRVVVGVNENGVNSRETVLLEKAILSDILGVELKVLQKEIKGGTVDTFIEKKLNGRELSILSEEEFLPVESRSSSFRSESRFSGDNDLLRMREKSPSLPRESDFSPTSSTSYTESED